MKNGVIGSSLISLLPPPLDEFTAPQPGWWGKKTADKKAFFDVLGIGGITYSNLINTFQYEGEFNASGQIKVKCNYFEFNYP